MRTRILVPLALIALSGCGSARLVERIDSGTGLSWTAARAPAAYARTDPRYSRAARDYVYVGPVETNRQGNREHLLWVGIATTLDRGFLAPAGELPDRLTLTIAGEPIELVLGPWPRLVGGADVRPYTPPVRPTAELGARVTADLLTRIDAAPPDSIRIGSEGGGSLEYVVWSALSDWSLFRGADRPR